MKATPRRHRVKGIHHNVSETDYFRARRTLSSTFVKLLTEHVPAKARARASGRKPSRAMNLGKAVHQQALGTGPVLHVWEHDGRTSAGKAERAEMAADIAAELVVAVTADEYDKITAMVAALHRHPEVAAILAASDAEVSAFWKEGDVWCQARYDLLSPAAPYDYKTTVDASRRGFSRAMAAYGYHQQAEWYQRGLKAIGHPARGRVMRFICQETEPPYLVQIHQPDEVAMLTAAELNDRALRLYAEATRTGHWAGYEPLVAEETPLPGYYFWAHEDELETGTEIVI